MLAASTRNVAAMWNLSSAVAFSNRRLVNHADLYINANLLCYFLHFTVLRLNGVPGCMNKWLLTDVVRNEFGFQGYTVTDWGAVELAVTAHKYYNSTLEAAAAAANAGVNLELPESSSPAFSQLYEAVQKGMVSFDTVVERVKPLFYTRMRLGEFDPPNSNPYASIDKNDIESDVHQELAVEAAMQTFVLLKNIDNTLPLLNKVDRLAVSSQTFCESVGPII